MELKKPQVSYGTKETSLLDVVKYSQSCAIRT